MVFHPTTVRRPNRTLHTIPSNNHRRPINNRRNNNHNPVLAIEVVRRNSNNRRNNNNPAVDQALRRTNSSNGHRSVRNSNPEDLNSSPVDHNPIVAATSNTATIQAIRRRDHRAPTKGSPAIPDPTDHHRRKAIRPTQALRRDTIMAAFHQPPPLVHRMQTCIPTLVNTNRPGIHHRVHQANQAQPISTVRHRPADKHPVHTHRRVPADLPDRPWDTAMDNTAVPVQVPMPTDKRLDHQPRPAAIPVDIRRNSSTNHLRPVILRRPTSRPHPVRVHHNNSNSSLRARRPPATHRPATTANPVLVPSNLRRPTTPTDHPTPWLPRTPFTPIWRHHQISRPTPQHPAVHQPDLHPINPSHRRANPTHPATANNQHHHHNNNSNPFPTNNPFRCPPHRVQHPVATSRPSTSSPIRRHHRPAASRTLRRAPSTLRTATINRAIRRCRRRANTHRRNRTKAIGRHHPVKCHRRLDPKVHRDHRPVPKVRTVGTVVINRNRSKTPKNNFSRERHNTHT